MVGLQADGLRELAGVNLVFRVQAQGSELSFIIQCAGGDDLSLNLGERAAVAYAHRDLLVEVEELPR